MVVLIGVLLLLLLLRAGKCKGFVGFEEERYNSYFGGRVVDDVLEEQEKKEAEEGAWRPSLSIISYLRLHRANGLSLLLYLLSEYGESMASQRSLSAISTYRLTRDPFQWSASPLYAQMANGLNSVGIRYLQVCQGPQASPKQSGIVDLAIKNHNISD